MAVIGCLLAGLLTFASYYLGAQLGESPSLAEGMTQEVHDSKLVERTARKTRWKHLDAYHQDDIDFQTLCDLALKEESISAAHGSALDYLVNLSSFEQAEAMLRTIDYSKTDIETRKNAIALLQGRLAKLDPKGAIAVALELPAGMLQIDLLKASFRELSGANLNEALNEARKLQDPSLYFFATQIVFSELGKRDPKQAFEVAYDEGIRIPRDNLKAICGKWVESDLEGATEALLDFDANYVWPAEIDLFEALCQRLLPDSPQRMIRIWEHVLKHDRAFASRTLAADMIRIWAEVNPQEALDFLYNYPAARGYGNAKSVVINSWISKEPEKALHWLLQVEDHNLQIDAINGLRKPLLSKLPVDRILQIVERVPERMRDQDLWRNTFATLRDKDYPTLVKWLNQVRDNKARNLAMHVFFENERRFDAAKMDALTSTFVGRSDAWLPSKLLEKWISRNPGDAWAWIETKSGAERHEEWVTLYTREIAKGDPASAMALIRNIDSPSVRKRETTALVREWNKRNPDKALDWIRQQLSGEERQTAIMTYLRHFSSNKAEHALIALEELNEAQIKEVQFTSILDKIDTEEAIALVRGLPIESKPTSYLLGVVAASDPERAIQLLNDTQVTGAVEDLSGLQEIIAQKWARIDRVAAINWAQSLPIINGENKALNEALLQTVSYDRQDTYAKEVIATISDENVRNSAISRIMRLLIHRDPIGTYEWVKTQGNEANQFTALSRTTEELLRKDSKQASAWVETLPSGRERDTGITMIIDDLVETSPGEAFPWALSLSEENRSRQQLSRVVREWHRVAPEEAYRAVKYSRDLSESQKQSLLEDWQ